LSGIKLYRFIAGIAVTYVSVMSLWKTVIPKYTEPDNTMRTEANQ
jgi:hypothetical protein